MLRDDDKNKGIKFVVVEDIEIPNNAIVKVKSSSKKIIVGYSKQKNNNLLRYRRISKNQYLDLESGRIINYSNSVLKSSELLNQNMKKLKEIVYLNFDRYTNAIFLTLTLNEENGTKNLEVMKQYTKNFFRNLKYNFDKIYDIAYIYKLERQDNRTLAFSYPT